MRFLLPAALAAVLVTGSVEAQEVDSVGVGASACGSWAAGRSDGREVWILGFLSGVGFATDETDPLNGLAPKAVWAWMDNYCRTRPLEKIEKVGEAFVASRASAAAPKAPAPNFEVCESQITDAYHQISSGHPLVLATITALGDMHCKGSLAVCDLGANNRRKQINANDLEKAEKTRMVLQALGCFQSWGEPSVKEPPALPPLNPKPTS